MLQLNGKTLLYDRAFTTEDGRQFPANFLRLSSLEEKQSIGIVEVPDPATQDYDQRFYTGVDTPKPLEDVTTESGDTVEGLKTFWKAQQDKTAANFLEPSDWRVVKAAELGTTVASAWLTYRGAVRTACNARQSEITAVTTVEALRELFFGDAQVQQTDSDGNGVVDSDGNPVMIANPGLATAWPELPS